jgi:hypothetical protein
MKWALFAATATIVASFWLTVEAAQPVPPPSGGDSITFEQYRDWRLEFSERRRSELAMQLSAADLQAERRSRLEQSKAYFDWLAGLPAAERDAKFRERFDRIDANHDGTIDPAERTAWRDKQRAFYHRDRPVRQPAAAETH